MTNSECHFDHDHSQSAEVLSCKRNQDVCEKESEEAAVLLSYRSNSFGLSQLQMSDDQVRKKQRLYSVQDGAEVCVSLKSTCAATLSRTSLFEAASVRRMHESDLKVSAPTKKAKISGFLVTEKRKASATEGKSKALRVVEKRVCTTAHKPNSEAVFDVYPLDPDVDLEQLETTIAEMLPAIIWEKAEKIPLGVCVSKLRIMARFHDKQCTAGSILAGLEKLEDVGEVITRKALTGKE